MWGMMAGRPLSTRSRWDAPWKSSGEARCVRRRVRDRVLTRPCRAKACTPFMVKSLAKLLKTNRTLKIVK